MPCPGCPFRCVGEVLLAAAALVSSTALGAQAPDYDIHAIRYGSIEGFPVSSLVIGAPADERMDIDLVFWVIRDASRTILFDTGFHRAGWFDRFDITDFLRPSEAVQLVGVAPEDVTDVIVSHAHWDHMGSIDDFPGAKIWVQADEYAYYTGPAWQDGGRGGGSDPADIVELVRRNTDGLVGLIDGDDVEILPGIRVYTGARHTYASQYIRVAGTPPYVLASDNAYLYRNLREGRPVATFESADTTSSKNALIRMIELAGDTARVVPGHDPGQFLRFPSEGRVARIR